MAPGKETLHAELAAIREQRLRDAIDELRRDLDEERDTRKNQCGSLFERIDDLRLRFNDERVSSAKSLGSAAAGGGATAGLIELIMHLIQQGGAG